MTLLCSIGVMRSTMDFLNWLFMVRTRTSLAESARVPHSSLTCSCWRAEQILGVLVLGFGIYFHIKFDWGSQLIGLPLSLGIILAGCYIVLLTGLGCAGVRSATWCWMNMVRASILPGARRATD